MPLGAHKAAIMGVSGVSTADVVLILSQTASGDASISFTSGIDSTYGEYIFRWYNVNPVADDSELLFQVNASGESGYNETLTSTSFDVRHSEADNDEGVSYSVHNDVAQGTAFQELATNIGNGADESSSGYLHLFNPSSTTYVKHWYSQCMTYERQSVARIQHNSGYFNITAAITQIQFKTLEDGHGTATNFDGVIKMWGVK